MELIVHAIRLTISNGAWIPFRMACGGVPLSHLFFLDDHILYARAGTGQVETILVILLEFGYYYGHKRILHPGVIPHIMTILPPSLDDQHDSIAWSRTDSGIFTLESAYKSFAETSWAAMSNMCETVLHILRDYPSTRSFWEGLLPPNSRESFFSFDLVEWILSNITTSSCMRDTTMPWGICWDISDSKHVIDLILLFADGRPLPLVQAILSMRRRAWCTEFIWVPRECNMVANSLSRLSIPPSFDLTLFDEAPTSIVQLLARDTVGPPYRRFAQV
ncbi:hypothetical protein V6N11_021649 [Hibiscus sabdariffa]|uniref:RNase H type-1 domain-containing protein n=2 Tax=Hibiscus sabdariffa TaxID=183260 RepID=A0ABR2PBI9_9ROSI